MNEVLNAVIDQCESTNDLVRKLGESGAPHGSWISAREQTAGRGRHGRSWISESGNLFLSVLLRDVPPRELGWVPLLTATFVAEAIDALASPTSGTYSPRIKWPNDLGIYANDEFRKGAGILCEGVSTGARSFLVVGIGVNCRTDVETDRATWCFGVDADELRERVVRRLGSFPFGDLKSLERAKADYAERSLLRPGDPLDWQTLTTPVRSGHGEFIGIGEFGELRVREATGSERSLTSEEIRLRLR